VTNAAAVGAAPVAAAMVAVGAGPTTILEVYSNSARSWFVALIALTGPSGVPCAVRFIDEQGRVREKALRPADAALLAPFGANLGGKPPPGFLAVPSTSRPGQFSFMDQAGQTKYATAELSWQAYLQKYITDAASASAGCPKEPTTLAATPLSAASVAATAPMAASSMASASVFAAAPIPSVAARAIVMPAVVARVRMTAVAPAPAVAPMMGGPIGLAQLVVHAAPAARAVAPSAAAAATTLDPTEPSAPIAAVSPALPVAAVATPLAPDRVVRMPSVPAAVLCAVAGPTKTPHSAVAVAPAMPIPQHGHPSAFVDGGIVVGCREFDARSATCAPSQPLGLSQASQSYELQLLELQLGAKPNDLWSWSSAPLEVFPHENFPGDVSGMPYGGSCFDGLQHIRQPATPLLFQERGLHQLRETPTGGLLQNFAAEHPVGPYVDETMPPSEVASIVADVLGRSCTTERFAPSSLAATSVRPILEPRQIGACSLDAISVAPPLHPEGPTVAANILKLSYISDELAAVRILNAERGARTPAVTQPAFAAAARSGFAPIVRLDGSVLC